jgi:hypothetical protein
MGVVLRYPGSAASVASSVEDALRLSPLRVRRISGRSTRDTAFEVYSTTTPIDFLVKRDGKTAQVAVGSLKPYQKASQLLGPRGLDLKIWTELDGMIRYGETEQAIATVASRCPEVRSGAHLCYAVVAYLQIVIAGDTDAPIPAPPGGTRTAEADTAHLVAAHAAHAIRDDRAALTHLDAVSDGDGAAPRLARELRERIHAAPLLHAQRTGDDCLYSALVLAEWPESRPGGTDAIVDAVEERIMGCGLARSAVAILMDLTQMDDGLSIEDVSCLLARAYLDLGQNVRAADTASYAIHAAGRRPAPMPWITRARASAILGDWKGTLEDLTRARDDLGALDPDDLVLLARASALTGSPDEAATMLRDLGSEGEHGVADEVSADRVRCEVSMLLGETTDDCLETLPASFLVSSAASLEADHPKSARAAYRSASTHEGAWGELARLSGDIMEIRARLASLAATTPGEQ